MAVAPPPGSQRKRLRQKKTLFFVFLIASVGIVVAAGWVLLFSAEPSNVKKYAAQLIVAFVSGSLGYLLGKRER